MPVWSESELALLRSRALRYGQSQTAQGRVVNEVVLFRSGPARYAIRSVDLREIRALRKLCTFPGSSPAVLGVFQYRGEMVSVHSLSSFFGEQQDTPAWAMIVPTHQGLFGLAADEILQVAEIDDAAIEPPPITLGERLSLFAGLLFGDALLIDPRGLFTEPAFVYAF